MTLEKAIKTALEYENKVCDTYVEFADKVTDPEGKRVFEVLGREEQEHIDYLESRLTAICPKPGLTVWCHPRIRSQPE